MSKFINYVQESYEELIHKVSWPTGKELQKLSTMVIIGLIVLSLIILLMDTVSKFAMNDVIYNLLG